MNNSLEPVVDQLHMLYQGVFFRPVAAELPLSYKTVGVAMNYFGQRLPKTVNGGVELHVSDVQASRKVVGAAAHGHKTHPCTICHIVHDDINHPNGYNIECAYLYLDF